MFACVVAASVAMHKGNAYIVRTSAMYARQLIIVEGPGNNNLLQ